MAQTLIEKARLLPADLKTLFFSDDPMLSAEEACLLYGIPEEKHRFVTMPLGAIFVGDMKLADYPKEIAANAGIDGAVACGIAFEVNKRIFLKLKEHFKDAETLARDWEVKKTPPVVSEADAKRKLFELEPWLLEQDKEKAEEERELQETRVKLPLLQALGKYARISEQPITGNRIFLKSQPEAVRPSLMNWLKSYREELGVGFHDPVLRAKFLFQSQNCKTLSSDDRERLNLILRSIEDNVPMDIDIRKMEIVFPSFQVSERPPAPKTVMNETPRPVPAPLPAVPPATVGAKPGPTPFAAVPPKNLPISPTAEPKMSGPISMSGMSTAPAMQNGHPAFAVFPSKSVHDAPAAVSAPKPFVAPPAPKRADDPDRSPFAIHPNTSRSSEPTPTISKNTDANIAFAPTASETAPAGFRMAKGTSFSSLTEKEVPKAGDVDAGNLSFSSNHTLPTEKETHDEFSIRRPFGGVLPSGDTMMPDDRKRPATETPPPPPAPPRKINPFQIRPMSVSEKERAGRDGIPGRIVDLRDEE